MTQQRIAYAQPLARSSAQSTGSDRADGSESCYLTKRIAQQSMQGHGAQASLKTPTTPKVPACADDNQSSPSEDLCTPVRPDELTNAESAGWSGVKPSRSVSSCEIGGDECGVRAACARAHALTM
eukprot:6184638-Pleurochrysis_carterae.AAC.2